MRQYQQPDYGLFFSCIFVCVPPSVRLILALIDHRHLQLLVIFFLPAYSSELQSVGCTWPIRRWTQNALF